MGKYVADLYVSLGYVAGQTIPFGTGRHNMKFFVSDGSKTEQQLKDSIVATLGVDEIAVIYVQEINKIVVGNSLGFVDFVSGTDVYELINNNVFKDTVSTIAGNSLSVNDVLTDPLFIAKVKELANVTTTAQFVTSNGSVIANATITQIDATTFDVTVPPELVGTSYKINFTQS